MYSYIHVVQVAGRYMHVCMQWNTYESIGIEDTYLICMVLATQRSIKDNTTVESLYSLGLLKVSRLKEVSS